MNTSVVFKNVSKKYKLYQKTSDKLLDLALPMGYGQDFYALRNISFTAEKGDSIAVIGVNGAGKSTFSNLITGIIPPSHGSIKVNGEASLISIASGLNTQLSGRENIELKLLMLGFSKQQIQELEPAIIEFADIGQFIDQPVKRYSSGMKSRLGFAISVNVDPDVLVIDEALSVGDKTFAQKCQVKMNEFKLKGKTIFFVSHSIGQIKEFCQKALWLEAGEIKAYGTIQEVLPQYEKFIQDYKKMTPEQQKQYKQQVMDRRSQPLNEQPANTAKGDKQDQLIVADVEKNSATVAKASEEATKPLAENQNEVQQIMEKIEASKGLTSDEQAHKSRRNLPLLLSNSIKSGRKLLVASGIVIAVSVGGIMAYLNWDNLIGKASTDKPASAHNVSDVSDTKSVAFSEKTPLESLIRWKFYYGDGVESVLAFDGKINPDESFATASLSEKPSIDESRFVAASKKFISAKSLQQATSLIGKSKKELDAIKTSELMHEKVFFNSRDVVDGITLDIIPTTPLQMIELVGKPSYQLGDNAYLYHGQNFDFIVYKNGGKFFNKITIRPALNPMQTEDKSNTIVETPVENIPVIEPDLPANEDDTEVIIPSKKTKKVTSSSKTSGKNGTTAPSTSTGGTTPSPGGTSKPNPEPTQPPKDNNTPTPPPTKPDDPKPDPDPVTPPGDGDGGSTTPDPEPPGDDKPTDPPADPGEKPTAE